MKDFLNNWTAVTGLLALALAILVWFGFPILLPAVAVIAVAGRDVFLSTLHEGLHAPEVVPAFVDEPADLDQFVVHDLEHPDTAGVVRQIRQVGPQV